MTFSKFNLLYMDTPLIQTISTVEYKVEKLKEKKVGGHAPEDQNPNPVGK